MTIIGAAAAYTIANADDATAAKIAAETASNGAGRLAHQLVRGFEALNDATAANLADAYKLGRAYIEAAVVNEKATLETVNELAVDKKAVGEQVTGLQKTIDQVGASHLAALELHMKAAARRLNVAPVVLQPTELEVKASKIVPKATAKVTANGYQGYREFITAVPADVRAKFPVGQGGRHDGAVAAVQREEQRARHQEGAGRAGPGRHRRPAARDELPGDPEGGRAGGDSGARARQARAEEVARAPQAQGSGAGLRARAQTSRLEAGSHCRAVSSVIRPRAVSPAPLSR